MIVNFGRYKGRRVDEIPTSYLRWAVRECSNLEPYLRIVMYRELEHRAGEVDSGQARQAPGGFHPPANLPDIIRKWYRGLAMKYHPDRDGSHEAMKVVNDAYEQLKQLTGVA
jgi:hypothetical protein